MTTPKSQALIEMYTQMAAHGYQTTDKQTITSAFNDMEIRKFRDNVKPLIQQFEVSSLLDYGCGGSDYEAPGFASNGESAKAYFGLERVARYEPARGLDERQACDAVVCFDVLEHIFITDVPRVIRELFGLTRRLLIINVACYSARAMLPNGENAHITVRPSAWWKGMVDSVAIEHPNIAVQLWCSNTYSQVEGWPLRRADDWESSPLFVTQA
jgi:hypothetical protein